ncbi:MAG TPA: AraC family transcriptional regulator [Steroidobacteraceae bacterium]|nr:AraC family transcriptional regulator [Steroidobacteraceae bacterium]
MRHAANRPLDVQATHGDARQLDGRLGLFRQAAVSTGPATTVTNLFANLSTLSHGETIGEHPERHLQGKRIPIERSEGHGTWELYRLDQDLFVVAADCVYDSPRVEVVPGEGLVEFHLRLSGELQMSLPGQPTPVTVTGPSLLLMYQPPGVDVTERIKPKVRDSGVSLYCRPEFLAHVARRSGITDWDLLEQVGRQPRESVWLRQVALSPTMLHIGTSLLASPYHCGVRLLHAESKALELLCEVLGNSWCPDSRSAQVASESEERRLETARQMLANSLSVPPRLCDVARVVGMSPSKLKRAFKLRFGVTVFDYGLECRMRHALELLRCRRMCVGQVAYAVGYHHQTSFAAAFKEFFGFLPSKARTEMH